MLSLALREGQFIELYQRVPQRCDLPNHGSPRRLAAHALAVLTDDAVADLPRRPEG